MSRTLEEMARLYADEECTGNAMYGDGLYEGYLAGYQAAQKDAAIEIEHLKGSIEALREVRDLWRQDFETYRRNRNK